MVCKKCERGKIVLHAFSYGKCEKCNSDIRTTHIPCDKLCESCSNSYNECRECGNKINNN